MWIKSLEDGQSSIHSNFSVRYANLREVWVFYDYLKTWRHILSAQIQ